MPVARDAMPATHTLTPFARFSFIQVAEYIKNRDGLKDTPNPDHIFLTGTHPLPSPLL
jgi:hypothetical protein